MPTNVLIVGCGSIGNLLGVKLFQQSYNVYGIRRNTYQLSSCIKPIALDLLRSSHLWPELPKFDYVIVSLTTKERTKQGYLESYVGISENLVNYFKTHSSKIKKVFYLSSTATYSQNNNQAVIINEKSIANSDSSWRSEVLYQAECLWLNTNFSTIINCSGIYGGLRWWLLNWMGGKSDSKLDLNTYSNRIHQNDIVSFIFHLISKKLTSHNRYILSDYQPTSYGDIAIWLEKKNFPISDNIKHKLSTFNPKLNHGKQCSNSLVNSTDFSFEFPTFKEGYLLQIKAWIEWQKLTEFQKKVLNQTAKIPWGKTQSYKDIGLYIESKAYRAIGQALKSNPYQPMIPCHRVIASNGTIGGFNGERSGESILRKKQLLANENVIF